MSKKRNLLAGLICFLFAFVCLVSCVGVTLSPELAAKQQAETDAQEVLSKLVWDDEDRTAIVSSLIFTTQNKNYPGVTISWSSSEEDIIDTNGKVNRPNSDDPRNVLVGEDLLATVVITATVVAEYSWEENGTQSASTEPITKQFTFTVLAKPEGTDTGTIEDVKLRAWNYIYVEQGVDKALVSNSSITYNVLLSGVVTAKLNAEGATKGFMLHDGTDGIYVYGDNTKINVGDSVEVIGGVYSYYGSLQVGSNVSVSKSNVKVTLPEYKEVTPQAWEDQNKGLGDEVIGHLGGDLYKVEGYLTASYNATTKDEFCITDANTGETSWIYYKSYTPEMKAELEAYVGKYVKVTGAGYDRDSRIVKNHLLWDGGIEEATAPVVDDQTKANVLLSQISLLATYEEDFDLNPAGVWEVVSGTGIEIADGVAKVTRADEEQTVVLKVTVTVGEATASKELTVTIKAIVKETPKHAGTKEDPYTVSDAVLVAGGLGDKEVTEKVYAYGTVKEITDLSLSYGNATFTITDGTKDIIVFRAKYLNGEKFTSEDQLKVGDVVVIVGQLTNYGGTLEFNSGCNIDSFGAVDAPVEGDGSKENPYSVEQALEICAALGDKELTEQVYVIGTISSIKEVSTSYGNATFNIGDLVVFRAKYLNNEKFTSADQIKVGDVVVVVGQLTNYGGTLEFNSGCYIDSFGTSEAPKHEHVACPECGKCTAKDCDGSAEEKCAGHAAQPTEGLKEGQAYKFQLVQPKAGKTVYFTGAMNGYYYATSEDINAGVDVYVEAVEGGYNLYFLDKTGAKHYMGIVPSGTHVNAVFDGEKTVFTYDATLKTLKVAVNGEDYVFGTRNDNTYTTIGANKVSYDPFYVTFVAAGTDTPEPPVHEHVFVEGKCECGEKDPDYVEPTVEDQINLTVDSLGISSQKYESKTATVNGVAFEFIQLGNYGNGIQMRDKDGNTSFLWNTSAFGKGIAKIELVFNSAKKTYDNPNAVIFSFGNAADSLTYSTKLSTSAGVSKYTITPDVATYTFFKLEHDINYSFYWDSITIYFEGDATDTPQPPVHEHEFVEGKCECGEVDPDYVAPQPPVVNGTQVVFDFATLETTMASNYNSSVAEMTVNGITFEYLQMKTNVYKEDKYLMFCKSQPAYLCNLTAFASAIVKIEVYIPGTASGSAGYFLSLHKEATKGNVTSETTIVGKDVCLSIEADAADGYTYFNLSSDSSTGKNGQLAKIVVTLADGSVVVPPVHEHKFVEGKCECGEVDPNYVVPEVPSEPTIAGEADLGAIATKDSFGYSKYDTSFTSPNGWVTTNAAIQTGGTADVNPTFIFIGADNTHKAACLNGKVGASGTLVSPTLNGGISKLEFKWGKAFTDTKIGFTVIVTDLTTNVKYEKTISWEGGKNENQKVANTVEFVLDAPIEGDFKVEFINDCPSASTSNKDRVSIFDIVWYK